MVLDTERLPWGESLCVYPKLYVMLISSKSIP